MGRKEREQIAELVTQVDVLTAEASEAQGRVATMSLQVEGASAMQQEYQYLRETAAFYTGGMDENNGVISPTMRKARVERSRRHFVEDGLIQRAALVYFSFVFGRGVSNPRLAADFEDALLLADEIELPVGRIARRRWKQQNKDKLPAMAEQLQKMVAAFWNDPLNRRYLTGYQAQKDMYLRFLRDGEVPMLLFPAGTGGNSRFEVALVDSLEITEPVYHPDKPGVVLWFLRKYQQRIEGSMQVRQVGTWYPTVDAFFDRPAMEKTRPADRSISGIGVADVVEGAWLYLIHESPAVNAERGYPKFWAALKWSGATVDTVSNLRTWLRARAMWAWRLLRVGGSGKVAATASKLESKLDGTQPAPPVASVMVHGKGIEEVEGLDIKSSGAEAFKTAIDTQLNMVCAATGIPRHYFGDVSAGKLTTADSVELSILKTMEAEQAWWTATYDDLFQMMARMADMTLDTQRLIEIDFPDIDATNAAALLPALAQAALGGIAPQSYAARHAAIALGEDDVEGWVDEILSGAGDEEPPESMTQLMAMVESEPLRAAPVVLRLTQRIRQRLSVEPDKADA